MQLNRWLSVVDPSRSSIMAACEFGAQNNLWQYNRTNLLANGWLELGDVAWQPDPALQGSANWAALKTAAFASIRAEIVQLQQLMQDDRESYLAEIDVQADGLAEYFYGYLGASWGRHPWTFELINCALAIGNIAYMSFKEDFKRVRPSVLCPGLVPPFGPPAHPAFPSGHSFLGHLIALLLLEIPALRQRYGMFNVFDGSPGKRVEPYPVVTIPAATPALVTLASSGLSSHGLSIDDVVYFSTTNTLPAGITSSATDPTVSIRYYVLTSGLNAQSFQFSATAGGAPVATTSTGLGTLAIDRNPLTGTGEITSPMLWLSQRLAKNRERLGVHYPSDSTASRHLAAAVWRALLHERDNTKRITCPALQSVLDRAKSEWPTKWP